MFEYHQYESGAYARWRVTSLTRHFQPGRTQRAGPHANPLPIPSISRHDRLTYYYYWVSSPVQCHLNFYDRHQSILCVVTLIHLTHCCNPSMSYVGVLMAISGFKSQRGYVFLHVQYTQSSSFTVQCGRSSDSLPPFRMIM